MTASEASGPAGARPGRMDPPGGGDPQDPPVWPLGPQPPRPDRTPDPFAHWTAPSGLYAVEGGRTFLIRRDRDGGERRVPLGNFAARVVEETALDDGAEVERFYTIEGCLSTGRRLPPIRVPAARYRGMRWAAEQWGYGPSIAAGQGAHGHLRAAIDEFSGERVPCRTVYAHLGWRRLEEGWVYLHAGGAVGRAGVAVDVDADLRRFALPREAGDVTDAVATSLAFLDLGDPRVTFPLWASVWRAAVCEWLPCLAVLWAVGETGRFKSTVVALALAHFGASFSKETLPASWLDTDNRLEQRSFLAKDVLLAVDDFCPERQAELARDMERRASRLIRAAGNRQGRGRLRPDLTARPTYVPRCAVVATAEQLPRLAPSALARILPVPFEPGAVDPARLSALQARSAALSHALRGFIEHLAPRAEALAVQLPVRLAALRSEAQVAGHSRLPESAAHVQIGLELGLGFAVAAGALDPGRAAELRARGWEVLIGLARDHARTLGDARPSRLFLEDLAEGLHSRACWLADRRTGRPAAGWAGRDSRRLGWIDARGVYLLPETAYGFACDRVRQRGGALPTARALFEMLRRDGCLGACEDGRLTAKPRCEGVPTRVLWLRPDALGEIPPGSGADGVGG